MGHPGYHRLTKSEAGDSASDMAPKPYGDLSYQYAPPDADACTRSMLQKQPCDLEDCTAPLTGAR